MKVYANGLLIITSTSSKSNQFAREFGRKIIKRFISVKPLLL